MQGQDKWVYHAKIDASGRLVIPAEARERHHINEGDTVVVIDGADGLRVKSLDQAIADAQAYFQRLAPAERILSDEINADRRIEAERD